MSQDLKEENIGRTDVLSSDATDEEEDGYSRRNFMETAAAMGAASAATGLSGCLGGSGGEGGTKQKGVHDFLYWSQRGYIPEVTKAVKETAAGFENYADQPVNVTTNIIVWAQVFPKWNASIQGRTAPNVSDMGHDHAVNFGVLGANDPVTDLFNKYDDWYDRIPETAKWDGEFWGMPYFNDVRTMYYREDLLEKTGHAKPPKTLTELVHTAEDVTKKTGNPGFGTPGKKNGFTGQRQFCFTTSFGGKYYDYHKSKSQWSVEIDSDIALFAHLFNASWGEKAWNVNIPDFASIDNSAISKYYRNKDLGMAVLTGNHARRLRKDEFKDVREKTKLALIPKGPDGKVSHPSFGGRTCQSPFTKEVTKYDVGKLDIEFLKYFSQPDTQNSVFEAALPIFMPVRDRQEQMPVFTENTQEFPEQWLNTYLKQAKQTARYGIYGGNRDASFLGGIEGTTVSYSGTISRILGADNDPATALVDMANKVREGVNKKVDGYQLSMNDEKPTLENVPEYARAWINGEGNTPKIWNPYE